MSSFSDARGAITRGLTGYFDFKGSATRRDYWTWIVVVYVVNQTWPQFGFLLLIPTLAYGVRRMHDVGRSGWWLLLFPVALYFSLKPSKSPLTKHVASAKSEAWLSTIITDTQNFLTTTFAKLSGMRKDPTIASTTPLVDTDPVKPIPRPKKPAKPKSTSVASELHDLRTSTTPEPESPKKHVGPSDSEVFMKIANDLGLVTANNDSIVAVTQSLIRRIWSSVRSQQEPDPTHTDHLRLAIRALTEFGLGDSKSGRDENIECAKAVMWYGIILALISTDDLSPSTLGDRARLSASDALRSAHKMFVAEGDQKMAARCMEELGQYGRLLDQNSIITEGFEEAVRLFEVAGAPDRAKQAVTNSGANFQRHSSAFFDGGQHSLRTTTILGSIQGERLRAALHHVD